ncbi:alpha/beta hydrolase-fold protein [soil metagenome]
MRLYLPLVLLLFTFGCTSDKEKAVVEKKYDDHFLLYSTAVQDSFNISIHLPNEYYDSTSKKYPVVYVTDANFYFPMLSAMLTQYEKGGLLPPLILVGIGYDSFESMDSLRVRDYLYPAALASDEMTTQGGGIKFYSFITDALIPHVDSLFRTSKNNRSLLGHSFGGYFSLYAMLNQVGNNRNDFNNFISASPSLWYHDFYLKQLTGKLKERSNKDSLGLFMTVGGLEDATWSLQPVTDLSKAIKDSAIGNISFETQVYNSLEHMDVGMLSFIKGLQKFYVQQGQR